MLPNGYETGLQSRKSRECSRCSVCVEIEVGVAAAAPSGRGAFLISRLPGNLYFGHVWIWPCRLTDCGGREVLCAVIYDMRTRPLFLSETRPAVQPLKPKLAAESQRPAAHYYRVPAALAYICARCPVAQQSPEPA
jgi:hypothetical protein